MTVQNTQWQSYHEPQPLPTAAEAPQLQPWFKRLHQLSQRLLNRLMTSEPIVKQIKGRDGQIRWYVSDPHTAHSAYLNSEAEVRMWLEARLSYQQPASSWNDISLRRSQTFR